MGRIDERAISELLRDDPDDAISLLADMAVATDPALRSKARALARRLLPRLGASGRPRRRGTHRLAIHAGTLEGELDLERTLDRTGARRPRHGSELVTRRFAAAPRAVCLLVDRSGSMGGHAVALAAVAASAVVSAAVSDGAGGAGSERLRCGVIAFASETLVLRSLDDPAPAERVIDDLLSLRGHGRTDLAAALRAAARLLEEAPGGRDRLRTAVLLSDCLHTRGLDPRAAAGALDCLHVLGTSESTDARAAGVALARRGGGRYLPATNVAELTVNLQRVLR
ncbi:MAG TPA: VWA domain-containing protein [Solirubrobacteraceae bacterium]|nr:VWA domain-containing protein [Solirubrobacteraceae bacterium]